jgi:hypothetical protein
MNWNDRTRSFAKLAVGAGMLLALSLDLASAAPARVAANTNLRQGPGTNYGVIATVPRGSIVDISGCAGEWCTAHWLGRTGYMIAGNLVGAPIVRRAPVVVYTAPPPIIYGPSYDYYYGPRFYGPSYYGPSYYGLRYRSWRRW